MERKRSSTGALGMFKIAQPICVPPRWPVTPRPAGSAIARGQGVMMPGKKLIQGQLSSARDCYAAVASAGSQCCF